MSEQLQRTLDEVIEAAAEAAFLDRWPTKVTGYTWAMADASQQGMYRSQARAALAAVQPEIEATALDEAANVFEWARDDADYAAFQGWLRDRAIEMRAVHRRARAKGASA